MNDIIWIMKGYYVPEDKVFSPHLGEWIYSHRQKPDQRKEDAGKNYSDSDYSPADENDSESDYFKLSD